MSYCKKAPLKSAAKIWAMAAVFFLWGAFPISAAAESEAVMPETVTDAAEKPTASNSVSIEQGVEVLRGVTPGEKRDNKETAQEPSPVKFGREMDKVRLSWDIVPGAVMYQLVLLKNEKDRADNIVLTVDQIYTDGVEIDLRTYGEERKNFYYKVCPLNYEGNALSAFSKPRPITDGEFNTRAPLPKTEFDAMAYPPLYPTYAWVPYLDAVQYQIRVYRRRADKDTIIAEMVATDHDCYEWAGYTHPDTYYWQIRALDPSGRAISEWSEKRFFKVTAPVTVAAFGDSITHGGGVTSVPPCRLLYDWETYSPVPIKNLGRSGDTTGQLLERFDSDVLPFKPKILVVMGGVNDYRQGVSSYETIDNLAAVREKCHANGIIPVFVTPTPINGWLMNRRKLAAAPYYGWRDLQQDVVYWVRSQQYFVDVNDVLTEAGGDLSGTLSTDGLHPDYVGKKHIGEKIGNYLREKFPHIVNETPNK